MNIQWLKYSVALTCGVLVLSSRALAQAATEDAGNYRQAPQNPNPGRPLPNPGQQTQPAPAPQNPNPVGSGQGSPAPSPQKPAPATPAPTPGTAPAPASGDHTQVRTDGLVSIKADGTDVRTALKSLFQQSGKNYVLEPGIYFALYVSLDNVDFDEAMGIICHLAKLKTDVRDGIYYVMPDHGSPAQGPVTGAGTGNGQGSSSASAGSSVSGSSVLGGAQGSGAGILDTKDKASTGVVTAATLYQRKVTVRFTKTDIRKVFAELGKQSSVTINVDSNVPAYKLDVVLKKTSLRYALNKISQAAGLVYVLENGQVRIGEKAAFKKVALNR